MAKPVPSRRSRLTERSLRTAKPVLGGRVLVLVVLLTFVVRKLETARFLPRALGSR